MKKDRIKKALSLATQGITEKEIIEELQIAERTMRRYKEESEELRTILSDTQDTTNKAIKELGRLAIGYIKEVEEYIKVKKLVTTTEGKEVVVEEVVKRVKKVKVDPDIQAIKYLLNNRDKNSWRDNPNKVDIDKQMLEIKKQEVENKSF